MPSTPLPTPAPLNPGATPGPPKVRGRVAAICVTYHPDAQLRQRLAPIVRQVFHLVIVDNGSAPETRDMLNQIGQWAGVTVLYCEENLGSARGLNIGIECAERLGCEYALLLDQDSAVSDDIVAVLTSIHRSHPATEQLAIVGAHYTATPPVPGAASDADLASTEVEAVIASGSLLWLPAFKAIGPFRDEFFIDFVDNEFCARARRLGYRVVKAQRTLMTHVIGQASRDPRMPLTYTPHYSADRLYYQSRNETVLVRESGRYRFWRLKSFARTFRRCKRVLRFERSDRANKLRGLFQGWLDGVRGRMGKRPLTRTAH